MRIVSLAIAALAVVAFNSFAEDKVLKVGDPVPDIGGVDETGKEVKLSQFKGKTGVVLFFYPKADTPGCTIESCGFSKENKAFTDKGYTVLGASCDVPDAQMKFKKKFDMPINLLSDPKAELAGTFGFKAKERKTVVIDKDGKIEHIYAKVVPAEHIAEVLKNLGTAQK
jgi:peroxiredoxin Q/BCP